MSTRMNAPIRMRHYMLYIIGGRGVFDVRFQGTMVCFYWYFVIITTGRVKIKGTDKIHCTCGD